jgi:uncharacterized membrane protein
MTDSPAGHDSALHRAKRPRTVLAGPYGHPVHATLITLPIGAWTASIVFDILALATHDDAFAVGAIWLIAIGLVGAVLAAIFGLMDFSNVAAGTRARKIGVAHLVLNATATVLFLVSLLVRVGEPDDPNVLGFLLSILAFLVTGGSGFLGGELAYRFGVRVADEGTQSRGYETTTAGRKD